MIFPKSIELEAGQAKHLKYDESRRYVIARDVTYDLLISAYNINTKDMFVARIARPFGKNEWQRVIHPIRSWSRPNIEFRAIGLQNGHPETMHVIDDFYKKVKGHFIEINLFGSSTRHIALDAGTGMSYNLLPLNRIFRPGELSCNVTIEQFRSATSELKFI